MWLVPLLLGVVVVCFLLARWGWWVYVTSTADPLCPLPLPPGGLGLPFIGEMINLVLEVSEICYCHNEEDGTKYCTFNVEWGIFIQQLRIAL